MFRARRARGTAALVVRMIIGIITIITSTTVIIITIIIMIRSVHPLPIWINMLAETVLADLRARGGHWLSVESIPTLYERRELAKILQMCISRLTRDN